MGSKGSTTTKQSFSLPPEFQEAYKKSIDMATTATSQPYQAYQGQLVAGLTPTQLQGISNVNAAQGMALPAISEGMGLTRRAAQGITPELYNQFYSPYTRDVADTTFANMMESAAQQRSGLKGGAIQAGAFGGDRAGIAQAEMARQQQLGLGQTMSNIYNQGYGQAMQLAGQQAQNYGAMGQQLAGLGVGAQGSVLQGAQAQLAAGAQQQATDQAQLQAAYEQWMQRQSYPYQQAQFFANIAQGLGAGAGGTSATTTPGPSWGSQALGALGAIGSIASFSDERMKENIEAVGTLNDGQTIYRYNFKGDPKTQIGLLAQEVETKKPDAVTEVKGLKMVDYKDATDKAASMGGLVTPDMMRQDFASGGVAPYPYASMGYVPEGKIQSGGNRIPDMGDAPPPFKDEGLAESWKEIMPLTKDQVGGLKALAEKMGIKLPGGSDVYKDLGEVEYSSDEGDGYARGGLIGRRGYALEGAVEDEEGVAAAPEPMADESAGLAAAEERPEKNFRMSDFIASDENPSVIERIMGRRLSPEARAAVLNASFAMMAGRSPFMGVNIGEAGKVGMQTYYNALGQQRELAKQKADIARQGFEAETGRMGVEVQERNAIRQQAALVLPIVRNLIALGQPVPPYLMQLIEGADISGGSGNRSSVPQLNPPDIGAPEVPSPDDVTQGITEDIPVPNAVPVEEVDTSSPEGETVSSNNIRSIMSQLPDEQNPYKIFEDANRAKLAGNPDLYQSLLEQGNKILEGYRQNGIPMPDGTLIPFPGGPELDALKKKTETIAAGEAGQVVDYSKAISDTQSTFTPRSVVIDGLRTALSSAETGKFSELKADIVNAAASLGLANAEQIAEAEDLQIAMKYFAQGVLDSGMKDKIGPQISNADLMLVAKGQGTVENLPVANRKIVGAMLGKLLYDKEKNAAFDRFVDERGGLGNITPTEIRNWERSFSQENKISEYVERGIADTPVAGELNVPRDATYMKPGYKYVHPNGRIFIYRGKKTVNGQEVPDAEWVN